ncbi:stage 0 sporulation protein J [Caballeronia temeraria]|uniref:Stage 0 sporulation protein J n=1 Tax=Caballeronia temeraria TaxID=1777137 RepID=A0A158DWK3_9BURK|nr:plasmid partitioning protein RepB C-terminal domain-containing protein [Caballeronia temeraria]SAK98992.1 stage 0 sporulation protein J [Caballeronia temeraria]
MNTCVHPLEIRAIPIDRIEIINHRERNSRIFEEIVGNIQAIGLKKPIVVTSRIASDGTERFILICGEGRLTAFTSLGEREIPALVVDVDDEDALIMSLAENIARRQYRPLELLFGIRQLAERGYAAKAISEKTGLTASYIQGILTLLKYGEERLLISVESGAIPLNAALSIVRAGDDDNAVQSALQEAYENGQLRGRQLVRARHVIEKRQLLGRSIVHKPPGKRSSLTASGLVRTYQNEAKRQKALVRKADFTQQRLLFIVGALRQLFAEENFVNLLRAEAISSLPKYLADRVWPGSAA